MPRGKTGDQTSQFGELPLPTDDHAAILGADGGAARTLAECYGGVFLPVRTQVQSVVIPLPLIEWLPL